MKGLSPRETQVRSLLQEGYTSEEIAVRLGLRGLTVRSYRATLKKKLEARDEAAVHEATLDFGEAIRIRDAVYLAVDHLPARRKLEEDGQLQLFGPNEEAERREFIDDPPRMLSLPPGVRFWKLAECLCTKKTYDSVFVPLLADFHHEYFECLRSGRKWKARWMRVLYLGAFVKSASLNVSMKFLREAWTRFRKA